VKSSKRLIAAGVVVLVVFVAFAALALAKKLDWLTVGHKLAEASPSQVALMGVSWIAALFVRPFRLLILIRAMAPEVKRRYFPVWCADLIAMGINSLIPMRAGDMAMALVLRQGLGLRTPRGFSAVLVDRFFDLLTVAAIFLACLSVAPSVAPWAGNLMVTKPIAFGAVAFGLWLVIRLRSVWQTMIDRTLAHFTPDRRKKWGGPIKDLFEGLAVIKHPGVMAPVVGLSVIFWALVATSYWFGARAVWPDAPFAAGAFTAGAVALSVIVPAPPAGVGMFHAVTVVALSLFNIPIEAALACAIICHAFQLVSVLVLAATALFAQGMSLRSLAELKRTRSG
jgi:uncharacterized protein (TIRG00374 family)